MIIVTHSPFVLSDVPRQNCLFLNDGNVEHPKNETFGANIHELLYSNFFIKDYMGSIARKAVDDIVKLKNMNDKNGVTQEMKEEDVEYLSCRASTIAEPYIRKQLMAIVEKVKKPSSLEIARQKRKALENQLEAINKEISILEQENDK